jgi:NADH-quinone oxidoreductase subunit N
MSFSYVISTNDWLHIAPVLTLLAVMLLVMIIDMVLPARARGSLVGVAFLGVLAAIASTIILYQQTGETSAFNGMVRSDSLSLFATLIVLVATGLSLLLAPGYIERQGVRQQGEYYALVLLASVGMLLLVTSNSLMTIFLGIELLSLPLYVLCAFAPGQLRAQEAGMKYFLLSSFASGFLLYGMSLLYGATGSTNLDTIHKFLATHSLQLTSGFGPLLLGSIALLAVGLAFKISAIPFHVWTPDVYEGAPTPVTALMAAGTKTAAFVALIRIFVLTLGPVITQWQGIIWALAIVTMIGGNLYAATQTNVKRMLAYSSIAHAGYILIGVAIGTSDGIAATMFYLASYSVMNIGAFGIVVAIERVAGLGTDLTDYNGLAVRRPWLAGLMAVFLFALAGFPGTVGFVGKYTVFYAAAVAHHGELTIIGVIASMVGFYYYLRVIWAMYFAAPSVVTDGADSEIMATTADGVSGMGLATAMAGKAIVSARPVAVGAVFGLMLALVGTVLFGIVPGPLFDLARRAAGLP